MHSRTRAHHYHTLPLTHNPATTQIPPSPQRQGVLGRTLGRVRARVLVMPSRTDRYFPSEDSEEEVRVLREGRLRVVETIWGLVAGGGGGAREDTEVMVR
ncbi:hypothetical protein EJ03DRAFT_355114 [Teratosphaeria nubilosa]|uniref:Uncharacterized protein n=1 Tax=Teratosphaeria nubilosa TaxID=161662 RepID=A0A6G1KWX0_9PEZI|nr:hypothetical protein EJ03DRAFT_355114 [Teratosphaeria nubilosa]